MHVLQIKFLLQVLFELIIQVINPNSSPETIVLYGVYLGTVSHQRCYIYRQLPVEWRRKTLINRCFRSVLCFPTNTLATPFAECP